MTDESTTDDQSEPDEQKADFAARAVENRQSIWPGGIGCSPDAIEE